MKSASFLFLFTLFLFAQLHAQDTTSNDVTQLNPIHLYKIIAPTSAEEIILAVKNHDGVISIGGGRYSMGGQTATENAMQIDMRKFDSILNSRQQINHLEKNSRVYRHLQPLCKNHAKLCQLHGRRFFEC